MGVVWEGIQTSFKFLPSISFRGECGKKVTAGQTSEWHLSLAVPRVGETEETGKC